MRENFRWGGFLNRATSTPTLLLQLDGIPMDNEQMEDEQDERKQTEYPLAKIEELPRATLAEQNPFIPAFGFFGMLIGGAVFAGWMGGAMAPETRFAATLSALTPPAGFLLGMGLWLGDRFPGVFVQIFGNLLRWAKKQKPEAGRVWPGSFIFIPISTIFCALSGTAIGFSSNLWSLPVTVTAYTVLGLVYGVGLWQMAETGHFPIPEES
jgi:hypothetical protein